jgi:hypothetical protein
MSDEFTKLFASRAERYPEPDATDIVREMAEGGATTLLPLLGALAPFIDAVWVPVIQRRRDAWFRELADDHDKLQAEVEGFRPENLHTNEAYMTGLMKATRIAMSSHRQEKRRLLRNALFNLAIGRAPSEDLQEIFLNAIDDLTVSHILVLRFLWKNTAPMPSLAATNYARAIQSLYPELRGETSLLEHILLDLRTRGYTRLSDINLPYPQGSVMTNMGIEFLQFVSNPFDE